MNILVQTNIELDPIVVEWLVHLPNASIHMSSSAEDTARILQEIKPSMLITDSSVTISEELYHLMADLDDLDVYFYEDKGFDTISHTLTKCSYDNVRSQLVLSSEVYQAIDGLCAVNKLSMKQVKEQI